MSFSNDDRMENKIVNLYRCRNCGSVCRSENKNLFCMNCGSIKIKRYGKKARENAIQIIAELEELNERLVPLWEEYIELSAQREDRMQTLRVYKKRGIISDDEIPRYKNETMRNALASYRTKKRKDS